MILCAGVLQPITHGKGTKRDQSPFLAQHRAGNGHRDVHSSFTRQLEQFLHSKCGTGTRGTLSLISLCPAHLPSRTLCFLQENSLQNREGGALVPEGSLCPCTEPGEMMATAAQLQP